MMSGAFGLQNDRYVHCAVASLLIKNQLSCPMTMRTIRIFIFSLGALLCLSAWAGAVRDQQVYPLPETETEDVVIHWLQSMGYHLRRSRIDSHGIRLFAQKDRRHCQITFWPHSPLATRVEAACFFNGKADPTRVQHLWTLLGDHMNAIMDQATEKASVVPAVIMSKTESVVCIYSGPTEKPLQISGFIIDTKGLIISTAHGLSNLKQPITVVLQDGRELQGRVIKLDKRSDLSLVDVKTDLNAPNILSSGRELSGDAEPLYNVVCSSSPGGAILSGTISGPPRKADDQLLWQVNMKIRPGSSGSPVFDVYGNLVAVVKGRYRGADKVGFLIPFTSVIHFLGDDQQ